MPASLLYQTYTTYRHNHTIIVTTQNRSLLFKYCIKEDFTLGYADSIGFRVGTCHPYYFINPKTMRVTDVLIHPMEIMECSLDCSVYMGLDYENAYYLCKKIIEITNLYNGELVLLWHNTSFIKASYLDSLYSSLIEYVNGI